MCGNLPHTYLIRCQQVNYKYTLPLILPSSESLNFPSVNLALSDVFPNNNTHEQRNSNEISLYIFIYTLSV